MTQKVSPFLEGKYGWDFGESGWNSGMDENLLKFSYLFDRNVDAVVSTLPVISTGNAYYLTTDNRIYFSVGGVVQSTPVPKWFTFYIKESGENYQFNGSTAVKVDTTTELDTRLITVEGVVDTLGSAAFKSASSFTTVEELDVAEAQAAAYTDTAISSFDASLTQPGTADKLGFSRSVLSSAITTVGGMLSAQWRNIWEFAGLITSKPDVLDPSTWDWQPAIQAAVNSTAGVVYFPAGFTYTTQSPVIVDGPVRLIGERPTRAGTNVGARIDNKGAGDALVYSSTQVIYDCGIEHISIAATTGHAINIKYGAVRCRFINLYLYTRATNKSCVAMLYNTGTIGVDWAGTYSCVFEGGEYIVDNVDRTAPIIDMLAVNTAINENTFRNFWLTQSRGRPAIRLMGMANGVYLTNNSFDGLTFEVCSGGLIALQATSHTRISGVSAWDMAAGYDGSLIQVSNDATVYQNRGLLIESFARIGNTLNGSAVDIDLGYSANTHIINHSPQGSAAAKVDFRGRIATVVGALNATAVNDGAVTYTSGLGVTAPEYVTKAGNKVRDLNGAADLQAPAGAAGMSSTRNTNTQRVSVEADTFYGGNGAFIPSSDNLLNLGHTTNRFKTIYAGTGTINTSDAREKREVRELSEAERAVAVRLKGLLRCFKFNDAVEQKGDGARIHCGVIAQDVKAAFEAEGLVAEHYAILCYDEWPEQAEVITDEGEIVSPYRPAGNRYGVRYEELLAFIICAM